MLRVIKRSFINTHLNICFFSLTSAGVQNWRNPAVVILEHSLSLTIVIDSFVGLVWFCLIGVVLAKWLYQSFEARFWCCKSCTTKLIKTSVWAVQLISCMVSQKCTQDCLNNISSYKHTRLLGHISFERWIYKLHLEYKNIPVWY